MSVISDFDAVHDALEICSDLGFEMVPGFSTHWSMASETMVRLGYADRVHEWASAYRTKRKHMEMPPIVEAIKGGDEASWKAALGDRARATDWRDYFQREVQEHEWHDVIATWWPRLMAGMSAGLTHGLIRTAHAMRSFDLSEGKPTALQLNELAAGLGYWAALFTVQPGEHSLSGVHTFPAILGTIPRLPEDVKAGLIEKGRYQQQIEGWDVAVAQLQSPRDIHQALSDMTTAFVQVNLAHDRTFPVPLIHTVTAPAALRMSLEHLPPEYHLPSFVAVWEATAAVLANFASQDLHELGRAEPNPGEAVPSPAELAARAVEKGDEHAIKFTEACLREYTLRPDERFLLAAARTTARLPNYFR